MTLDHFTLDATLNGIARCFGYETFLDDGSLSWSHPRPFIGKRQGWTAASREFVLGPWCLVVSKQPTRA